MAKTTSRPNLEHTGRFKVEKVPLRFKEHEELLKFPEAPPQEEGPMGMPADVSGLGYKIRFTDPIWGGYRVNVLRDDGTAIARGINVRRFWTEQYVKDDLYDNTVAIKLSFNCPQALRITVMGEGEITREKILRAAWDLADENKVEIMAAAEFLGKAAARGHCIKEAVAKLARCLSHESRGVRVNAAFALGEYAKRGGDISEAEAELLKAAQHEHASTRKAAARALMHHYINARDELRMEFLLNNSLPDVRIVAAGVLERRSPGL
jgi:hypothetical protein